MKLNRGGGEHGHHHHHHNHHEALKFSSFFFMPERPREYLLLFTRFSVLTCLIVSISLVLRTTFLSSSAPEYSSSYGLRFPAVPQKAIALPPTRSTGPVTISHIQFCIAGAAETWLDRSQYTSLWWRNTTRGFVWLDKPVNIPDNQSDNRFSIPVRVSDPGWTRFRFSSSQAAVRIARVIWDSYRLNLPDVRWFVMGDDDTVFFPENLVKVLSKYDHEQMWYVGGNSESVEQDVMHAYDMAFGGGGFAISRPLAARLASAMDGCLQRYFYFYGSDQRIAACVSEIGVPFTEERGFHQVSSVKTKLLKGPSFLSGSRIETTPLPLLLDAGKARGRRRREICYIFLMVSLAPSQSSRLVSCFALTQSVSLDLVPSKLEQTFVVSAQVFKTTGDASFTGVSRKSCTRSTFHLLPYSEFALHMCFRSERPSVGCSGSELRSDKDQNSAIKNTSGHRSASSLNYKRGSVSLLGGCSTPNIPNIIAFSPPSCATVLHPDNEVLLSFATHTLVYKLRPDVLRSSSASHPESRVPPARLVVNGPNFNCLWAWPSTTKEGSGPLLSQSIPTAYHNESQLTTGLIILTSLKNSEGFLGIYIMHLLLYHSYRMNFSVDSLTLLPVLSSSSTKERILLPCLFSVKGDDSSGLIPRVCFNLLTGLPPCVAVCTGPEGAIETISVSLVGEGWLSTSQHKLDIRGDPYGFLAAHPLTPLVSLHHLVYLDPMFPNKTPIESLQALMRPYTLDPHRILQQIHCYDRKRHWSISISWGYSIQIYTYFLTAKELDTPLQTFKTWRSSSDGPFTFNTRPLKPDPCERPVTYFMDGAEDVRDSGTKTWYSVGDKKYGHCGKSEYSRVTKVKRILVTSMKMDPEYWNKAPRRPCCEVMEGRGRRKEEEMSIRIRKCRSAEMI